MPPHQALRLLGLAGLGALASLPALAQDDRYYYGGLSVGRSRSSLDESAIVASRLPPGVAATAIASDDKDTGYKVFGGYRFSRHFGVEAGYFDLGKFKLRAATAPAGTLDGRIEVQGINLDLVGTVPLSERLSALARVGAQHARTRSDFSGDGAAVVTDPGARRKDTNVKYGVGLQYAFSDAFMLRGEAERYRIDDAAGRRGNVNLVSLSLVFPFGRAPAPTPRMAMPLNYVEPAPALVAVQAPLPPPAPPPPPAAPVPRRVSFSAESLFGFDQSNVRPEGRSALDAFAKELDGTAFGVVTVEGHTDRLGATVYNQTLSQQRADAVKDYLVNSQGLDATKVAAVGKGEAMPVTKPEDCSGNQAGPQLIACLQPDRRVEIEVAGTR